MLTNQGSTYRWRKLRAAILNRDRHTCRYCGAPAITVDQKIPRSSGGTDHPQNLVAACQPCNRRKAPKRSPKNPADTGRFSNHADLSTGPTVSYWFTVRSARARFETRPTPGAATWLPLVRSAAQRLGTPLMPWQGKGARLLCEYREELCDCHTPGRPLPRWKTVVVSVSRQQGKTVLSRAVVDAKARSESRLAIFGTAQTRQYAAKHVVKLGEELTGTMRVLRGVGTERVDWPNGSTYQPISPSEGGGHGDNIDFMLVDEGWTLEATVMGGIRPAMIARPHSQMLIISTMGTVESHVWNQIVARGRDAVDDPDSDLAYIEYSAGC